MREKMPRALEPSGQEQSSHHRGHSHGRGQHESARDTGEVEAKRKERHFKVYYNTDVLKARTECYGAYYAPGTSQGVMSLPMTEFDISEGLGTAPKSWDPKVSRTWT